MHARDLVKSQKKPNPEGPKRKAPTKVPSWHLTGDKTMQYITDSNVTVTVYLILFVKDRSLYPTHDPPLYSEQQHYML